MKAIDAVNFSLGVLLMAALVTFAFTGCSRTGSILAPPDKYLPGQQFGDGGATPCMNGVCPVINEPKQWLKPCS